LSNALAGGTSMFDVTIPMTKNGTKMMRGLKRSHDNNRISVQPLVSLWLTESNSYRSHNDHRSRLRKLVTSQQNYSGAG
jgi:hypothetical protein